MIGWKTKMLSLFNFKSRQICPLGPSSVKKEVFAYTCRCWMHGSFEWEVNLLHSQNLV